ncbi:hypothetical protein ACA910_005366 [Epithemia clementina (nom. ined.)]
MDYHRTSLIKLMSALSPRSVDSSSLPQLESSMADSGETSVSPIMEGEEDEPFEDYHSHNCAVYYDQQHEEMMDEGKHTLNITKEISRMEEPELLEETSFQANKKKNNLVPSSDATTTTTPHKLTRTVSLEKQPEKETKPLSKTSFDNQDESQVLQSFSTQNSFSSDEGSMKLITELEISTSESVQACPSQTESMTSAGGISMSPSDDDSNRKLVDFSLVLKATKNASQAGGSSLSQKSSYKSTRTSSPSSIGSRRSEKSRADSPSCSKGSQRSKRSRSKQREEITRLSTQGSYGTYATASTGTISTKHTTRSSASAAKQTIDHPPPLFIKETIESAASSISAIASSIHAAASSMSASTRRPLPKSPTKSSSNDEYLKKLLAEEQNRQSETEHELEELLRLVSELQLDQFAEEEEDRQKKTECALWEIVQLANSLQAEQRNFCSPSEAPQLLLEAVTEEEGSDDDTSASKSKKRKSSGDFFLGFTQCGSLEGGSASLLGPASGVKNLFGSALPGSTPKLLEKAQANAKTHDVMKDSSSEDTHDVNSSSKTLKEGAEEQPNKDKEEEDKRTAAIHDVPTRHKLRSPMYQQRDWHSSDIDCGYALNKMKDGEIAAEKKQDEVHDIDNKKVQEGKPSRRLTQASSRLSSTTGASSHISSAFKSNASFNDDLGSVPVGDVDDGELSVNRPEGVLIRRSADHSVFRDVSKELGDFDRCGLLGFGYVSDYILQLGLTDDLKHLPDIVDHMTPPTEITIPAFNSKNRLLCNGNDEDGGENVPLEKSASYKSNSGCEADEKDVEPRYSSDWEGIKAILDKHKSPISIIDNVAREGTKEQCDSNDSEEKTDDNDEKPIDLKHSSSWDKIIMDDQEFVSNNLNKIKTPTPARDKSVEKQTSKSFDQSDGDSSEFADMERTIDPKHGTSWEKMMMDQDTILDTLNKSKSLSSANGNPVEKKDSKPCDRNGNDSLALEAAENGIDLKYSSSWDKMLLDEQIISNTLRKSKSSTGASEKSGQSKNNEPCGLKVGADLECEDEDLCPKHSSSWEKTLMDQQDILDNLPDWIGALSDDQKCLFDDDTTTETGSGKDAKRKSEANLAQLGLGLSQSLSRDVTEPHEKQERRSATEELESESDDEQQDRSKPKAFAAAVCSLDYYENEQARDEQEQYLRSNNSNESSSSSELSQMIAALNKAVASADSLKRQIKSGRSSESVGSSKDTEMQAETHHCTGEGQEVSLSVDKHEKKHPREAVIVETVLSDSMSVSVLDEKENDCELKSSSWLFDNHEKESPKSKNGHKKRNSSDLPQGSCLPQTELFTDHTCHGSGHHHRQSLRQQRALRKRHHRSGRVTMGHSNIWTPRHDRSVAQKALAQISAYLTTLINEVLAANEAACSAASEVQPDAVVATKRTSVSPKSSRKRSSSAMAVSPKAGSPKASSPKAGSPKAGSSKAGSRSSLY